MLTKRAKSSFCNHSSVQSLSHAWLCDPMDYSMPGSLSFIISWSLLKLMSTELMMPSYPLILCRPFLLLPSIFLSIRVFSNESVLPIRWPKFWSFSFSISPSNEYSGLISFGGTLKSLLQTTVQKNQSLGTQLSSQSNSHIHTWLLYAYWKNHSFDCAELCWQNDVFVFLIWCLGWS